MIRAKDLNVQRLLGVNSLLDKLDTTDLRQGLAVGRERQESTPDLLRQHLEVNLDALRAVNAVEEGLRAEQLDV